ncbi:MAG: hypothetical protein DI566_04595 [Microbacterium sp.]|nr:MAG: hypothetical protein DI566_04595 [Microbacterium sp.]
MLELRWFGSARVARDQTQMRFDTRKATALLAYVSVAEAPVRRDALCELLWPALDRAHARAALRRTLSVAAAGVPELAVEGDGIALADRGVRCDVREFRVLLASDDAADWRRAADLATGEFLGGFALRDAPAFEQWQAGVGATLRDDLSLVLGMLATDAVRSGRPADALGYARRRVEVDPLAEPAYVDLIRILAAQGDRSGAFAAYRALTEVLDTELGITPLAGTTALLDAIRVGEPGARARAAAAPEGALGAAAASESSASRGSRGSRADEDAVDAALAAVENRLAAVDDTTRQVVEALAVLDRAADSELVRVVAGRTADETDAALAAAERAGLVAPGSGGGETPYRVSHRLVGVASRAALPLTRERLLNARAAETLARLAEPGAATAERIGQHFAASGRDADAAVWFVSAAEAYGRAGDHAAAVEALRSAQTTGRNTVAVHVALATALVRTGRVTEAMTALGRAADLAGDDPAVLGAARDAVTFAEVSGDREAVIALRSHYADLLHSAGRDAEAREQQQRWAAEFAALEGDLRGA